MGRRSPVEQSQGRLAEISELKARYLREIDIFGGLSAGEMHEINTALRLSRIPKGRLVYQPDQTGEALFVLKTGLVEIYRLSPEGKRFVVANIEPGTFFGEMAFVGQRMYGSHAETLEDSILCVMSRADLEGLIKRYPQIAVRLVQVLAERISNAEGQLEDLALKSLSARLATLILHLTNEGAKPLLGLSHNDLAERVGTSRETATQVLNVLKAAGLIEIGRTRIVVMDAPGLRGVAESY